MTLTQAAGVKGAWVNACCVGKSESWAVTQHYNGVAACLRPPAGAAALCMAADAPFPYQDAGAAVQDMLVAAQNADEVGVTCQGALADADLVAELVDVAFECPRNDGLGQQGQADAASEADPCDVAPQAG